MTIGDTIRQLLEERKKVILPGFGNLGIVETSASVPASGKRIDPPGMSILFDSSFSKDDNLLAATFATNASIDPGEAGQQVLELVDAIKFAFDKGEAWAVKGAGIFSRDDDGKVHFQPEKDWVLAPDQYGLESMELLELDDAHGEKESAEPIKNEEVEPDKAPEKEKKEPVDQVRTKPTAPSASKTTKPSAAVHEPWKTEKPKRRVNPWRVIWIIAGSLIVILVALIAIPSEKLQIFEGRDGTDQPVVEEPADGSQGSSSTATEKPAADDPEEALVSEPEQSTPAEELPPEHKYFLIAGSFKHLGNASELQDQLKDRGYHAEVMVTENRLYRVSVISYATKLEAEQGLSRIKSVPGLESCWLLSNE